MNFNRVKNLFRHVDCDFTLKKAVTECIDIAGNAEKHRWHNLKKTPNDLPNDIGNVLVCGKSNKKYVYFTGYYSEGWVWNGADNGMSFGDCKWEKVIAWREIEPFEDCEVNN